MGKQKKLSRKERAENLISKWAFTILFALCIQFLVYLLILNVVPTFTNDADGNVIINPLYFIEKDHYGSSQYDNGTRIIYYYNMVLLVATIVLILYYFVNFMEHNDGKMIQKIKKFLKEQWPFAILLVFMFWVFISSLQARDYYRSFVGCFNLKDGYLSFMMYGSMLVCSMLLGKNNEKYKKIIVNTFLITATIVAALTLWNYYYINSDLHDGSSLINSSAKTIGEVLFGNGGYPLGENFLIVTKRIVGEATSGIFHNSNHYGYYLSICVIVAAVMFMKQSLKNKDREIDIKNVLLSVWYFISYIIMLKMAILNNTLGAYLGISASLIFMIVYATFPKRTGVKLKEGICTLLIVAVFAILSATTVNTTGKNIVYSNFSGLANDFKILIGANTNEEDDENTDMTNNVSGSTSIDTTSGNNSSTETTKEEEKDVADIGSGRGILWAKAWEMALQKPFFGYGLENIKYEYDEQFDINEGRSHNLILQLAATTGIVGMLLYVVGIASIWIRKLKYIKEWDVYECLGMFVIVSYIISSLVGNSGFYTSGYFYIFVGFVVLNGVRKEEKVDEKKEKLIETLTKEYIGKNADKIMNKKRNDIAAFCGPIWFFIGNYLMGPAWFLYRKAYFTGIVYFLASISIIGSVSLLSNLINSIALSIILPYLMIGIWVIFTAFMANKWYLAETKIKIENIIQDNNNKSEEQLIEIVRKKGGTNKVIAGIYLVIGAITIVNLIRIILGLTEWIIEFMPK